MENYKELLTELYKEHAPEKLDQIDFYLNKYQGKEKQFYIAQKAKYANKRSVKDSKKILAEAMARINKDKQKPSSEKPSKTELPKEEKPAVKKPVEKKKKDKAPADPVIAATVSETLKKEPLKEKVIKKNTPPKEEKKEAAPIVNEKINPPVIKKAQKEEPIKEKRVEEKKVEPEIIIPVVEKVDKPKEEKIKQNIEPKVIVEKPVSEVKEEKKKSRAFWYFLIVLIVFLGIVFVIYCLYFSDRYANDKKEVAIEKVQVEELQEENIEALKLTESDQMKEAENMQAASDKKETLKPSADRLYASDLPSPAIFVACFAEKKEELAQKKVTSLKSQGLDAHYYWIPDIDAKGNSFFKIVIGPFNTHREAYPSLTRVQERINFDAYILVVK